MIFAIQFLATLVILVLVAGFAVFASVKKFGYPFMVGKLDGNHKALIFNNYGKLAGIARYSERFIVWRNQQVQFINTSNRQKLELTKEYQTKDGFTFQFSAEVHVGKLNHELVALNAGSEWRRVYCERMIDKTIASEFKKVSLAEIHAAISPIVDAANIAAIEFARRTGLFNITYTEYTFGGLSEVKIYKYELEIQRLEVEMNKAKQSEEASA